MKLFYQSVSILFMCLFFGFSYSGIGILGLGKLRGIDTIAINNTSEQFAKLNNLLTKGVRVDLLINRSTIERILAKPYNPNELNLECALPHFNKSSDPSTTARWYRNPNNKKKWIIPVKLQSGFSKEDSDIVYTGMLEIQWSSCIDFFIFTSETLLRGFDYVKITRVKNYGCFSNALGRLHRGMQQINLEPQDFYGRSCIAKGIVVHELLHALGFAHQQNAPERDNYMTIVWDNLPNSPSIRNQFLKLPGTTSTSYGASYDYHSVMHYGRKEFSKNGNDTIVPKLARVHIGQRRGLSILDSYKINQMYECSQQDS